MRLPLAWTGMILASATAISVAHAADRLMVTNGWSRPAAEGGTGVGYLTLTNRGAADALIGAASPVAERVELHASSMAGGMMRMSGEDSVALPANGAATFAPGGRHLMFVGLKRQLRIGERLPVTLRFKSGAMVTNELAVRASPPEAHPGHH